MIEVREIDEQVFIVARTAKREELLAPGDAVSAANAAIADAELALRDLAAQGDALRAEIEEAVLFDEPTEELRARLAEVTRAAEAARGTVGAQRNRIAAIRNAVDQRVAERLRQEHAAHLAALVAPFEQILQECQP